MPVTSPIAQSRVARAQARVDRDPVRVGLDADGLEPDSVDARTPAGRDEQAVAAQLAAVLELEDVVLAVTARGARARAEDELDAVAPQDLAERLAERRRLACEHVLGALDERNLAAEPAHGLGHLDADRAAAEDEQPPRDRLHAGRLAVGPDAVELAQPRDRRDDRVGAGRHHDVLGGVARRRRPRPTPVPASRPWPRSSSMPWSASHRSWPASE